MTNRHIFEYIDDFIDMPRPPHYAVMLTGPWGIGKTYNIKRYLETLDARGKKAAYVSLYGLSSAEEVTAALLTSLLPVPDKRFAKFGDQLGRALSAKLLRTSKAIELVAGWMSEGLADIMVFDDLERSKLSVVEVFGILNAFIEHDGRRIVIVANENELANDVAYRRIREKIIGITFELVEQSGDAVDHFIAGIECQEGRAFCNASKAIILAVFAQSNTSNLRILDQSLRDWARVYKVIGAALRLKEKGVTAAFRLFLALSLEVRAGRIGRADFSDRLDNIVRGSFSEREGDGEGTPLSKAQKRYEPLYLHAFLLMKY